MSKRVALSISLTTELAAFVAEKVGSGRYGSASEVVRMGLRLLEERDGGVPRRGVPDAAPMGFSHDR